MLNEWRTNDSWPQKPLAGFLQAQDVKLQSVSHLLIQQTFLQILGAKACYS